MFQCLLRFVICPCYHLLCRLDDVPTPCSYNCCWHHASSKTYPDTIIQGQMWFRQQLCHKLFLATYECLADPCYFAYLWHSLLCSQDEARIDVSMVWSRLCGEGRFWFALFTSTVEVKTGWVTNSFSLSVKNTNTKFWFFLKGIIANLLATTRPCAFEVWIWGYFIWFCLSELICGLNRIGNGGAY